MDIVFIHSLCFIKSKFIQFAFGTFIWILMFFSFALTADVNVVHDWECYIFTSFMYDKFGFGDFKDFIRIQVYRDFTRTDNPDAPGYYYEPPAQLIIEKTKADSSIIESIKPLVRNYLKSQYYSDMLIDSLNSAYLLQFKRLEFFGRYLVNGIPIRLSGWHGKFVHIIVSTDYNSKSGFIKEAEKFFSIGELDEKYVSSYIDNVPLGDGKYESFYSYDNNDLDFKLIGYTILGDDQLSQKYRVEKTVIDLTIYAKEQSDGE